MMIITKTTIYFYKRKGIKFWLKIIYLKLRGIEYEILEE